MRPSEFWMLARWFALKIALPVLAAAALLIAIGYLIGRRL